ncbi:response regulator [Natronobacterium gregoryi]|uniref:Response regulator n=2 Tax=Natronobacterium gregoryi TaxID=44930 RepID=L0AJ95_NATGS|nr:response regulator [Natronobacterium gregoryi]AFZ73973.1 response regulator with CheY-like receiver domain and winged-helix DNA-binding domain [Natronobacterium gregoryi SP2]ELY68816.1 response regulator receiver protein [Natronobacterium gregoryi SP2]PLK18282.1 response regulator [Natronobacterium gregoryi SP2]SFJ72503.1 Response regulator receiver domain-containing protein [Natronobacterium gregoryi]
MTSVEDSFEILLVEDETSDVRLVRGAFGELSVDVTLTVIGDGADAVDVLRHRRDTDRAAVPHLVLLGLDLRRMDGFEFLETLRADDGLARLPVLVLAESSACDDVRESYDLAANAYLTKPTDPDEYTAMVAAIAEFWFEQAVLPRRSP